MTKGPFKASKTGVRLADYFRDNLIIDRHDPIFASMRACKTKHLRSENSEDAVTWNVFRTLRQINPGAWMRTLAEFGCPGHAMEADDSIVVDLWRGVTPPPGLVLLGDEGVSEIDVIIETAQWVWFIEAKYNGDISTGTTTRSDRNQIIRNIDVGSYYAGVRKFYFSLLVRSQGHSPVGCAAVDRYRDFATVRQELLPHRPDCVANLRAVTVLTWGDLGAVLRRASECLVRSDEREYAERALTWMTAKGLSG